MSHSGLLRIFEGLLLLLAGAALFFALDVPGDLARWQERERQIRALEQSNAALEREIQDKQERLRRLQTSQTQQELRIRQEQKRVRPGETTFILPEQPQR